MTSPQGLSQEEARARLADEGYNELPRPERRTLPRIALEVMREPMFALLLGSGAVYLLLGDLGEALLLLGFASVSVIIAIVQASRSERVLDALRDLSSPRALVIRDGARLRIPGREVARGDWLLIGEGDRVPADALLREASDLQIDESLLTGESVPVRKLAHVEKVGAGETALRDAGDVRDASDAQARRPGGDDLPYVFSGTLVVRGQGLAEVVATGPRSEIGKIGVSLGGIDDVPPRLTRETRRLVRVFGLFGLACCLLAVALYGMARGAWLDATLAGIALGMSMLPEEFPLVLTVFTVMGAWRISRARVLTRRAAAIETLGAATVLCTDKTGTLTENRMAIAALAIDDETLRIVPGAEFAELPAKYRALIEQGRLACAPEAFDPMDKAFHQLAASCVAAPTETLVHGYGLRPDLLAVTQIWRRADGAGLRIAAKGAPEAIAELCRLDETARRRMTDTVNILAAEGMRVLAVAHAEADAAIAHEAQDGWPASPRAFAFRFAGLVGLADPLRASVPDAVKECRAAGIRVVMITGDYPATARAIAKAANIATGIAAEGMITGDELEALSDAALRERIHDISIFARTMPTQKLRIVQALKAAGEVVAMTGDGVNDAPSLKAADIGIAMGGRGTDVAREAAALVLLDDDFGAIVKTVRLGRRIYDNLRKAMGYIFAIHLPIAGLALLPLLLGQPPIFLPIHIAFLEMVIDPVCSIVFEAEREERDIMQRPPRAVDSRLFSRPYILWSLSQGLVALAILAGLYLLAATRGLPENEVRALTFVSLVLINLGLVLVNRSFDSSLRNALQLDNRALFWVGGVALALLSLPIAWLPASELFRFGPLHAHDLIATLIATGLLIVTLEMLKWFWRWLGRRPG